MIIDSITLEKYIGIPTRPAVFYRTLIPGYYITITGDVYSCFKRAGYGKGYIISDNPSHLRKLKPYTRMGGSNSGHQRVCIYFDAGTFDYDYRTRHGSTTRQSKDVDIHILVMHTWKPYKTHPPERLSEVWNQVITEDMVGQPRIPDIVKLECEQTTSILHGDGDPTHNYLENLRYGTARENSHDALLHFGGNTANKKQPKKSELDTINTPLTSLMENEK